MARKSEPRAGRIDYDVDGTLSGNWFKLEQISMKELIKTNILRDTSLYH